MNNDGWGQMGAGQDDMRIAGSDLQHHSQKGSKRDRSPSQSGGPMKEALDAEMARHQAARETRLRHLEDHYKR